MSSNYLDGCFSSVAALQFMVFAQRMTHYGVNFKCVYKVPEEAAAANNKNEFKRQLRSSRAGGNARELGRVI